MINQLRSIMENLSDIYYLVQLIDLILYKFFWIAAFNDDFDVSDSKLRGMTFRNLTSDILAFSILCSVLFILVMFASSCEKDCQQLYSSAGIETVAVGLPEESYCVANIGTNCFHACGDSLCARGRIPKRNFSDEDVTRVRTNKRSTSIPKKSIFGLNSIQLRNSQSTQTTDKIYQKSSQKWLIRRTRSGHIYGKYPI
ncbi:uncharacterized protein LOC105664003 isoform X2 [Megachile rotundata]|uniref:uncharacterized protein LOC105664003 isoform X2 n=1 Tax=Megachile rotundata TaxID=143995 RepID=UPI000614ECC9|nr:PREDICTED: uncharacterized protein LOC105664003 isoform X2 [Megachile rotundata]